MKFALWVPEMASAGGVQSYMWRLWEMLHELSDGKGFPQPVGLSLLDSPTKMQQFTTHLTNLPDVANGNRKQFIYQCFNKKYKNTFVIVGHPYQAPIAWLAKKLGYIKGYIVILHGIEAWEKMTYFRRKALQNANSNVTTTFYTAKKCAQYNQIPKEKFTVIPLCADANVVEPDQNFQLSGDFPILFVGRLAIDEQYKGLDSAIHAVKKLLDKGIKITLHVVGDGDDRLRMETMAKDLGLLNSQIIFHGRVTNAVLQRCYSETKAFVMPSKCEGFGIVFLEAMRYGIPCIGGNHGGTPEVIEEGQSGFLVEFNDVDTLAERLEKLTKNPQLSKSLGNHGKHLFQTKYSFQTFKQNFQNLLLKII